MWICHVPVNIPLEVNGLFEFCLSVSLSSLVPSLSLWGVGKDGLVKICLVHPQNLGIRIAKSQLISVYLLHEVFHIGSPTLYLTLTPRRSDRFICTIGSGGTYSW